MTSEAPLGRRQVLGALVLLGAATGLAGCATGSQYALVDAWAERLRFGAVGTEVVRDYHGRNLAEGDPPTLLLLMAGDSSKILRPLTATLTRYEFDEYDVSPYYWVSKTATENRIVSALTRSAGQTWFFPGKNKQIAATEPSVVLSLSVEEFK